MELLEVKQKVKQFLVEEFEIREELITDDASLKDDLGIESLDFIDIVVIVEDVFGFKIKTEEIKDITTFDLFCKNILEKAK